MARHIFWSLLLSLVLATTVSGEIAAWSNYTFTVETSQNMLYYAYTAYCPKESIEKWDCNYCEEPSTTNFTTYSTFQNDVDGTFGYTGYHAQNQTIYVTFRGSVNLRNWIVDFFFPKKSVFKNYTGVKVHSGFYDAYKNLAPKVTEDVTDMLQNQCKNCSIMVTGHSLGAALSTLCGADLVDQGFRNVMVWNFGDPRIGNHNFTDLYRELVPKTFRLINRNDIVPAVPLIEMGFWHEPTEVWENGPNGTIYTTCNGSGEDPNCHDSVFAYSAYDHVHYMNMPIDCQTEELENMVRQLDAMKPMLNAYARNPQ